MITIIRIVEPLRSNYVKNSRSIAALSQKLTFSAEKYIAQVSRRPKHANVLGDNCSEPLERNQFRELRCDVRHWLFSSTQTTT